MNYLVLDVGGSAIKFALMNDKVEFLEKGQIETPKESIEEFTETIGGIFDKYKDRIEGIAISMPGIIDSSRGFAHTGGSLLYNYDKDIASILKKRCPINITIENDGKCAALAEAWMGSLSDCNDGIVVVLGTAVGGGIIKDKKLHRGRHFMAGEFSNIITNIDDIKEGKKHLWAMDNGYEALIDPVAKVKDIPNEELDGHKIFEMANGGDKDVLKVLDDYCYSLVLQLFNLQHIYDPEKIAIGGGISEQDILIEYIHKNIEKYLTFNKYNFVSPEVVRCKYRNDSNLIGALYHYLTKDKDQNNK